jgi:hypothetical protein
MPVEFIGTALLLATVFGSGVMGAALAGGNNGIALLAQAFATAGVLCVPIVLLGPIPAAHFNPVVTLVASLQKLVCRLTKALRGSPTNAPTPLAATKYRRSVMLCMLMSTPQRDVS